jgi:hypothetical protein
MKLDNLNPTQLVSELIGKTVRYENTTNKSSVTCIAPNGKPQRTLKIKSVDSVNTHPKTGKVFVTAKVGDVDDEGTEKWRNLYIDAMETVC